MAVLYITEFRYMAAVPDPTGWPIMAPLLPVEAEQSVAIGATSAASNAFNNLTTYIMLETDSVCSLAFGTAPSAVTTAHRMAANELRFYAVPVGKGYKVAVIANT